MGVCNKLFGLEKVYDKAFLDFSWLFLTNFIIQIYTYRFNFGLRFNLEIEL